MVRRSGALLIAGSLVVGAVLVSCADGSEPDVVLDRSTPRSEPGIPTNDVVAGEALPDVVLAGPDGEVSTSSLLGTPLLINFWYSSCKPCEKELPELASMHAEFGDRVRFVGVNTLDADFGASFAAERGVTYELYGDASGLADELGVVAFPVTVLVAADGTILRQAGVVDEDRLRALFAEDFQL
jgi:thiol-disulfide isomerase/thioredoxin